MAATIKFVKPEHEEILREYLCDQGVVLVFPNQQELARKCSLEDGDESDYDFGGDADVWVDTVSTNTHYIFGKENDA